MSLKNNLRIGQASLEYFIIFAVIAGLTLLSAATFLPQVRDAAEDLFNKAAGRIIHPPTQTLPPTGGEILPWSWGSDGQLHVIYGIAGQKKTYIFRVPPGTKIAGGHFYAYDPATVFTFTFTSVPGYKWHGYDSYTGTIRYSSDAGFDLTPESMTPTPTDGFVPPGDYIVEILWTDPPYIPYGCPGCLGRILITTGKI